MQTLKQYVESNYHKSLGECSKEEVYVALLHYTKEKSAALPLNEGKKKVYYISAEFLIGKLLSNNLINLGIYDEVKEELEAEGHTLAEIEEIELEPSLGNGGLGRLAACFLDSIATLGLPGDGVGLNYHFGLFEQKFKDNQQNAVPNQWLTPDSWLVPTDVSYEVPFANFTLKSKMFNIDVLGYEQSHKNQLHLFDVDTIDESLVHDDSIAFDKTKIGQYVLDADGNPKTNVPYFDLTKGNTGNGLKDISKYIFEQSNMMPTTQYSHGVYLQEQLEYKFLKLLFSGRIENFTDELVDKKTYEVKKVSQTAFIPRIGLVAEVNKNINLYATWMKGFEPQSGAIQSDPDRYGGPFDAEYSRLYEVGMKSEWFQKRLSATVALFNLKKMNALYAAPIDGFPDRMEQVGEEVSKGIEFDVAGFITPNWSIIANYSYNDAKITKTKDGKERDFGMQRPNTPRHSGNLWMKYIIGKGIVKGLGFGAGYNFVTERYGQVAKRSFPITYPSYGIVDVALYYKVQNIQLQANLNNVFNKIHWVGGYDKLRSFPGAPRNVSITVSYKF